MIVLRLCFALNANFITPLTNSVVERQALGYLFPVYIHLIYAFEVIFSPFYSKNLYIYYCTQFFLKIFHYFGVLPSMMESYTSI